LPIRLVESNRDLTRPQAANVGLDHCHGEHIIFLDDDDYFEPDHISSLHACLINHPDYLVAFAGTRILSATDEPCGELKIPFNRLALLRDNYIQIGAALFSAKLLGLGCRFDEEMLMFQDWDFWIQACCWTAFAHTRKITANWRAYSGESGAGLGNNYEMHSNNAYKKRIHDKWRELSSRLAAKYKYSLERSRQLASAGRQKDAQKWISSAQSIVAGKLPTDVTGNPRRTLSSNSFEMKGASHEECVSGEMQYCRS
jgi:glycosyltransferase involved in cell wall biosynthesis